MGSQGCAVTMDIRQLQYLVALARERHFTKAADACNVTQPTLSSRIRQLEQELGIPLVERGQRFMGLTPDGERILKWAYEILDGWTALKQEVSQIKSGANEIEGRISLGVIPSALPITAQLTGFIARQYPKIDFSVTSLTSSEILGALEEFTIDIGLTYIDNEPVTGTITEPLYTERYCLFVNDADPIAGNDELGWAEAANHSLCLLSPNMQNRRIIDKAFRTAGAAPVARVETNSVVNLYANVRHTGLAAIMPEYFFTTLGPMTGIKAIPLKEPEVEHVVGAVVLGRDPLPPLLKTCLAAVRNFSAGLDALPH
jgi:DNA-binding transcriptional LysR family regulator